MKKRQTRLSHITFTLVLEELMSGPSKVSDLVEHSGMTHRYLNRLMRTMHRKKVVHIAGWDKDTLGRYGVRVYGLGAGKDAPRKTKTREQVNKEYRTRVAGSVLAGSPFAGLMG